MNSLLYHWISWQHRRETIVCTYFYRCLYRIEMDSFALSTWLWPARHGCLNMFFVAAPQQSLRFKIGSQKST